MERIEKEHGLEAVLNEQDFGDLWLISKSRSSLQHLYNWITVGDKAGVSILQKLRQISDFHDVHFQWIPSHVNIFGNKQADLLDKEGCNASPPISSNLTYSEHQSRVKFEILKEYMTPFNQHSKTYALCSKSKTQQASPDHILDCLGLLSLDLFSSPLLALDILRVNDLFWVLSDSVRQTVD
ncbi:RNase H domain-containing protein [Trichonephila clavipes]|nr:RNase H domain-containing protein [Trichonephila clavipes]